MGVNAIRTSHNPPAPEFLDITDRLGVLVMDEAFDTWEQTRPRTTTANTSPRGRSGTSRRWSSAIATIPASSSGASATRSAGRRRRRPTNLMNWVKALDTTRSITWASNKMGGPHVSEGDDRNVAKLLDVVGLQLRALRRRLRRRPFRQPDLEAARHRDLGGRAQPRHLPHARRHGHEGDLDVDGGPAVLVLRQRGGGVRRQRAGSYNYESSRAFVAGSFIWAGFDYIGEPTPYSSWPSKSSYYGAIDTAGFPKDVYYFYKSRWTTAPMAHVLPHWNWTAARPSPSSSTTTATASSCS